MSDPHASVSANDDIFYSSLSLALSQKTVESANDALGATHDSAAKPNVRYWLYRTTNVQPQARGIPALLGTNLEIEQLRRRPQPVFFECAGSKFLCCALGYMDTALFEYEAAFDITLGLSKADWLRVNESPMVILGVHLDGAGIQGRYSWRSEVAENKGSFVRTDAWLEKVVFQVAVPKALAPQELAKLIGSGERVVLPL